MISQIYLKANRKLHKQVVNFTHTHIYIYIYIYIYIEREREREVGRS